MRYKARGPTGSLGVATTNVPAAVGATCATTKRLCNSTTGASLTTTASGRTTYRPFRAPFGAYAPDCPFASTTRTAPDVSNDTKGPHADAHPRARTDKPSGAHRIGATRC